MNIATFAKLIGEWPFDLNGYGIKSKLYSIFILYDGDKKQIVSYKISDSCHVEIMKLNLSFTTLFYLLLFYNYWKWNSNEKKYLLEVEFRPVNIFITIIKKWNYENNLFTFPSYSERPKTSGAIYAGVPTVDLGFEWRIEDYIIKSIKHLKINYK